MNRQTLAKSLLALATAALVTAPLMLLYAHLAQSDIKAYQRDGVTAEAVIVEKHISRLYFVHPRSKYHVKISFFTRSILQGGELVITTINEFVHQQVWEALQEGGKAEVIFLPQDPENKVIFTASMDPTNLAPIEKYELGSVTLGIGIVLMGFHRIAARKRSTRRTQRRATKPNQARANQLVELGNAFHREKKYEQAIAAYEGAIALFPPYGSFKLVVGDMLFELGCYEEAAQAYREVLEFVPGHDQARDGLEKCLQRLGGLPD